MKSAPLPGVPKELLEHLRKRFPSKFPSVRKSYEEYLVLQGEQNVMATIERLFDRQMQESMNVRPE